MMNLNSRGQKNCLELGNGQTFGEVTYCWKKIVISNTIYLCDHENNNRIDYNTYTTALCRATTTLKHLSFVSSRSFALLWIDQFSTAQFQPLRSTRPLRVYRRSVTRVVVVLHDVRETHGSNIYTRQTNWYRCFLSYNHYKYIYVLCAPTRIIECAKISRVQARVYLRLQKTL